MTVLEQRFLESVPALLKANTDALLLIAKELLKIKEILEKDKEEL